tara:strand:- start:35 stop:574 length:540 start_codon:yes stop_codon:yes gene_type:complete
MPTADSFTALGRGNGFPFCLINATDSAINSVNGDRFQTRLGILRVQELSLKNTMAAIWNLYSISFPGDSDGNSYSDSVVRYGAANENYVDATELNPTERVCSAESLGLELSPLRNSGNAFIANTNAHDRNARFEIHGLCFATDTSKYYLMYMAGFYFDDYVTLISEIPLANLTLNYYTY